MGLLKELNLSTSLSSFFNSMKSVTATLIPYTVLSSYKLKFPSGKIKGVIYFA